MLQTVADAILRVNRTSVAQMHFNCPTVSMKVQHWLEERAIMEHWTSHSRDERYVPIKSGEPTCNLFDKAEV